MKKKSKLKKKKLKKKRIKKKLKKQSSPRGGSNPGKMVSEVDRPKK